MARATNLLVQDPALLAATLEGLEAQKSRIEEQIQQIRAMLGRRRGRPPASAAVKLSAAAKPVKRQLSPAARKRIAAAQKKRWAEFRKKAAAAKQ